MNKTLTLLTLSLLMICQNLSATNYTTLKDGNWTDTDVWSTDGSTACGCVPDVTSYGTNHDVFITDSIHYTAASVILNQDNSITVQSGGKLYLTGNLNTSYSTGFFQIDEGGEIDANNVLSRGGFSAPDNVVNGFLNARGRVTIDGNRSFSAGSNSVMTVADFINFENVASVVDGTVNAASVEIDQNISFTGTSPIFNITGEFTTNGGGPTVNFISPTLNIGGDFDHNLGSITMSDPVIDIEGNLEIDRAIVTTGTTTIDVGNACTGDFTIGGSGTVDFSSGTVNVQNDILISGGTAIVIDADLTSACGDFVSTGGPGATFNGAVSIPGSYTSSGGSAVTINSDFAIGGPITISSPSSPQIQIGAGGNVSAASITSSGGSEVITVDGALTVYGDINVTNGSGIGGTGLVGFSGTFTTDNSGSGLYCDTGVDHDGNGDAGDGVSDVPFQSMDLSTCAENLPVTYIYFKASKTSDNTSLLTWATSEELNSEKFIIERSINGRDFSPIGEVQSAGTTTEVQYYTFTDDEVENGTYYYRLVQVDFDGKSEPSKVRHVSFEGDPEIKIHPNPTESDEVSVHISLLQDEDIILTIANVLGQTLHIEQIKVEDEFKVHNLLPDTELINGYYLLIAQTSSFKKVIKFYVK